MLTAICSYIGVLSMSMSAVGAQTCRIDFELGVIFQTSPIDLKPVAKENMNRDLLLEVALAHPS